MAGLLDQHQLIGDLLALSVARDLADYFVDRVDNVLQTNGSAHWQVCRPAYLGSLCPKNSAVRKQPTHLLVCLQDVLNTEYGGMSETLTVMSTITGQRSYLRHALRLPILVASKEGNRYCTTARLGMLTQDCTAV